MPLPRVFLVILCLTGVGFELLASAGVGEPDAQSRWKPLYNRHDLEGWHVVLRNGRSDDPDRLVQVHDGLIHMYKDAPAGSAQPAGYIVTEKEYSNYHLRLEYKWGEKHFAPRANVRRDAGILYHVIGKDGVWPTSLECQIQENDVGDIFTVNTRLTALVDPLTTNLVANVTTNEAGIVHTNQTIRPVFLAQGQGGVSFVQGVAGGIRRVVRNPMCEHEGWNTVEVIARGDDATYIVNGKVNNRATKIEERTGDNWVPLRKGRIGLQLEYAEVYYRNIEIEDLKE